ncbi:MAG: AAA family ATPase [Patescibacteria group bacterium]
MNLIFLYGPPAVGKLTVANELEKLTGYKNFHNHIISDMIGIFFEWGHPARAPLVNRIREDIIDTAAKAEIPGVIFTYVYDISDQPWIDSLTDIIKRNRGTIYFVQLIAPEEVLMKRVNEPSREKFHKVKTQEKLKELMDKFNLFAKVQHTDSLTLDTNLLQPNEVAQKIVDQFQL